MQRASNIVDNFIGLGSSLIISCFILYVFLLMCPSVIYNSCLFVFVLSFFDCPISFMRPLLVFPLE